MTMTAATTPKPIVIPSGWDRAIDRFLDTSGRGVQEVERSRYHRWPERLRVVGRRVADPGGLAKALLAADLPLWQVAIRVVRFAGLAFHLDGMARGPNLIR